MDKIKVHELAKEINVTSNDILNMAKKLKIELKSHLSSITEEDAKKIKDSLVNNAKNKKKVNMKDSKNDIKENKAKKEEKPFVVRRAVIMEEDHTEKKEVKEEKYGKIAKKNKGDYNIVYKKEEEKPMSISQLFGLVNDKSKGKESKEEKKDKGQSKKDEPKVRKTREDKNRFERSEKPSNNKENNRNFKPRNRVKVDVSDEIQVEDDKAFRNYEKEKKGRQRDRKRDEGKELASPRRTSRREDEDEYDLEALNYFKGTQNLSEQIESGEVLDYYEAYEKRTRKKRPSKTKSKPKVQAKLTKISIPAEITVKSLAQEMKVTVAEVLKKMMDLGLIANINSSVEFDTAYLVASEFKIEAVKKNVVDYEEELFDESEDKDEDMVPRPPVVVVMGHVDHGKTSLLDAIRKEDKNVVDGESGGITQHIGAYQVEINGKKVTFIDTPGHAAFTSMRARGAKVTDIAILVVAANDGVMPQTIEAINHAKAAGVPIIVAINKMDLQDTNVERIKQELMAHEIVPEEWGGDTIFVPISAKKGTNIDTLLEMILLEAEMLDLKANATKQAKGTVIESRLDKKKGPICTLLVERGQLNVGDTIVVGSIIGNIRKMVDYRGRKINKATPSMPVEVTGLTKVPLAGDVFYEVKDEKMAKKLIEQRAIKEREEKLKSNSPVTLDDLFNKIQTEKLKELNLIVKGDTAGTVEALKKSLEELSTEEIRVKVVHANVGGITENDIILAEVAKAIVIGFNVRPNEVSKREAEDKGLEIKTYSVIYSAIDDVKAAMEGLLEPELKEEVIGKVEVRELFTISKLGTIAGSYVLSGKVTRNSHARVIRDDIVVADAKIASLKRGKDDAREVNKEYECGIMLEGFNDFEKGDILEVYEIKEIKRTLK